MKTNIFSLPLAVLFLLSAGGVAANAQNGVDFAARIGSNNYYGTARTLGMGNAVTAVGGDLGSIGINPAGSAVNNYGQVVLSPGLSIASSVSSYDNGMGVLGAAYKDSQTKFFLPNAGFAFRIKTRGTLKGITLSFTSNATSNYNEYFAANGINSATSFFANAANGASGIPASVLGNYSSYTDSNADWALLSSYRAQMIGDYGTDGVYVAGNELLAKDGGDNAYHYVPGDLKQTAEVVRSGSKNDIVLNIGFDIDNWLYIGANLGMPIIRYRYNETFEEKAVRPDEFPIINEKGETENFVSARYDYACNTSLNGVYGKIGVIARPAKWLRLGLAVQTPTAYSVTERWDNAVTSKYSVNSWSAYSPEGSYGYSFTGPWIVNAGIASTIKDRVLLSADYELTNYNSARYGEKKRSAFNDDYWASTNNEMKRSLGKAHSLRLGAEYRISPKFAVRGGYNLSTSPIKGVSPVQSGTLGFGYSSAGSFFMDLAAKLAFRPSYDYYPYLYGDYKVVDKDNLPVAAQLPMVSTKGNLCDIVLTLGWRF